MAELRVLNKETPRDKATVEVHKAFAESYDEMIKETGRMSGFIVLTFDDQGNPTLKMHVGEYFPIPTPMLPKIASDFITAEVYR